MTIETRNAVLILALLGVQVAGTAVASLEETDAALAAAPSAVPRPDLSVMEEAARSRVERAQAGLERMVADPATPPALLGEAFGEIGLLFHAYKLLGAAAQAYDEARRRQPGEPRWDYLRGVVHQALGEHEAAAARYEAALAAREEPALLVRLADVQIELGRLDAAKRPLERLLALGGEGAAAAHYGLGRVAAAAGDPAGAVEHFEQALALQPEATVVEYPLGQAYRRLGDVEKARAHLARRGDAKVRFPDPLGDRVGSLASTTAFDVVLALARESATVKPSDFLGYALSQLAAVPGAIEQLARDLGSGGRAASASALERSRLHYVLAGLYVSARRDEEAVVELGRAVVLDPDLQDARVKLGNALARLERLDEAVAVFDAALARVPDDPAALLNRAVARAALGRRPEARADLERLVAVDPGSSEAQLRLAAVLEEDGDAAAATARYEAALGLSLTPRERAGALIRLGAIRRRAGDLDGALARFEEARAVEPENVEALGSLGGLLAQRGRLPEAIDVYAAWAAAAPRDVRARLALGATLIYAGRYAEARTRLETATSDFPAHHGLRGMLARHLAACPDRAVRDGKRAALLAEEVYAARKTPEALETLAMAYAETGRFAEAVARQQELIRLLPATAGAEARGRLERNLALYQEGKACCD